MGEEEALGQYQSQANIKDDLENLGLPCGIYGDSLTAKGFRSPALRVGLARLKVSVLGMCNLL